MIFEDDLSEIIYDLYLSGKTEQEILNIINLNTEEENLWSALKQSRKPTQERLEK